MNLMNSVSIKQINERTIGFQNKNGISYHNCSDLLWEIFCSSDREKLLKLEAEGQEFAKFLRSLDQFI